MKRTKDKILYRFNLDTVRTEYQLDSANSKRHQALFFSLGYFWAGDTKADYKNFDKEVLYLRYVSPKLKNKNMEILFSDRPFNKFPGEVECKLLHPKQKIFLIEVLANVKSGDYSTPFKYEIDSILEDGYYREDEADWLNGVLKFNIKNGYKKRTHT